jgi:hypothetical protein
MNKSSWNQLKKLTEGYIDFMSNVGSLESKDYLEYINTDLGIFQANIAKIENGKEIVKGFSALLDQLKNARSFAFPWNIKTFDIMCDVEKNMSVVRFSWDSSQVGLHITTAILKFNREDKISEINEVYNKLGDISH